MNAALGLREAGGVGRGGWGGGVAGGEGWGGGQGGGRSHVALVIVFHVQYA